METNIKTIIESLETSIEQGQIEYILSSKALEQIINCLKDCEKLKTAYADARLCINCNYLEIGNPQMFCCFYDAPCNGINDWCHHFKKRKDNEDELKSLSIELSNKIKQEMQND